MLRLVLLLLMGAASSACAFAAVGWSLYAQGPAAGFAAQWFGGFGAMVGLVCGGLHMHFHGMPDRSTTAPLPAPALAGMVRATLASAAAERQARPGSVADRKPAPAAPMEAPVPVPAAAKVVALSEPASRALAQVDVVG